MTLDPSLWPVTDPDSRPFWEACRRHELRLQRCSDCGHIRGLPSPVCPACTSCDAEWQIMSGNGEIYSFTHVHQSVFPGFREKGPYTVAWIDLAERRGLRILSLMVDSDPGAIRIGAPVEIVFEDVSPDLTIPRFRLKRMATP